LPGGRPGSDPLALARLFRSGELTSVKVPDEDDEAMRDLTRAREDAICVERRAKQRTAAFLLRHGRRYPGKTTWGRGHWHWLGQQVMNHPAQQIVLREYLDAVREASARVLRLTEQIRELIPGCRRAPWVAAYQALRGVSLIVAATVVAEVGDLSRFNNPKELMAYLGLVPSEHSSGASVRRGRITKTGNGHARRVLVEAAWALEEVGSLPQRTPVGYGAGGLQRRRRRLGLDSTFLHCNGRFFNPKDQPQRYSVNTSPWR
jgi:transposase